MSIVLGSEGERVVSPEATRLFDRFTLPVMILDRDQRFVYANDAYLAATHTKLDAILGRKVFDCFPDTQERVASVEARFRHTIETGETTVLDAQPFQLTMSDGKVRDLVWQAVQDPVHDPDGRIVGMIQRAEDVTQQHELQRRNDAISHELSHRVKNIMAVVTSVARITARNATDIGQFTRDFINRLQSIARTNEQLALGDWRGLSVRDILEGTLAPYREDDGRAYSLDGPDVRLSLEATKDLSMVTHELATNAAKYSCLGEDDGALTVSWRMEADALHLHWKESCRRDVTPPEPGKAGFGSRLMSMLPYIDVERDFQPDGLSMTIVVSGDAAFA